MKTREPKDLFVASHDDVARSERESRSAWDVLAAFVGLMAAGVALEDGQPLPRALVNGVTAFGLLEGGLRIVVGAYYLFLPLYEEIVERILFWRAERSIGRARRHPAISRHIAVMRHHILKWRNWHDRRIVRHRMDPPPTGYRLAKAQDLGSDADAWRWGDIASFKLFDKPIHALIDDFESTMGGIPVDTLAAMIGLGREIEKADAERASAVASQEEGPAETTLAAELADAGRIIEEKTSPSKATSLPTDLG